MTTMARPIKVFYSYAHEDESLCKVLETHLSLLKKQGLIADWHDRRITAGEERSKEIDKNLEAAELILLLVSADFLASDYRHDDELKRAMVRHKAGEARVIPILLRPVDYTGAPFSQLQCLPTNARPVTSWENTDEAFKNIAQEIRRIIQEPRTPPGVPLDARHKLQTPSEQAEESRIDFKKRGIIYVIIITFPLIIGGFIYLKPTEKNPECDSVTQAQNQKLIILSPISGEQVPRCDITIRGQVEGFRPDEINNRGLQVEVKLDNISGSLLSGVNSEDGIWSVKKNSCVKGNVVKLIAILKDKGGKKLSAACRSVTLLP